MHPVRKFRLARFKERRTGVATAADVRKRIKESSPSALGDDAQIGIDGVVDRSKFSKRDRLPSIPGNSNAGHASRYHRAGIEAAVNGSP